MNYRGYVDVSGNIFDSYEDACRYYGADTPAQCETESRYWAAEEAISEQDAMEARGGPIYGHPSDDDFIPF